MDEPKYLFRAFGTAHLTVLFLTIALPFLLALVVHRTKSRFLERSIAFSISPLLLVNYMTGIVFGCVLPTPAAFALVSCLSHGCPRFLLPFHLLSLLLCCFLDAPFALVALVRRKL